MKLRAARTGLTLVELVVAMTIFALLMSAAMGTYAAVHKTMTRIQTQEDIYQTGRVLLDQLTTELASAYQLPSAPTSSLQGQETSGAEDLRPADVLTFLTTAHPIDESRSRGDLTQLTYSMNNSDEPAGLYLEEDFTPGLEATDTQVQRYWLSPLVISFACKYLPVEGDWVTDWTSQTTLPMAVRVELTLQDRAGQEKPVTLVATTNLATATAPAATTAGTTTGTGGGGAGTG